MVSLMLKENGEHLKTSWRLPGKLWEPVTGVPQQPLTDQSENKHFSLSTGGHCVITKRSLTPLSPQDHMSNVDYGHTAAKPDLTSDLCKVMSSVTILRYWLIFSETRSLLDSGENVRRTLSHLFDVTCVMSPVAATCP